MTWKDVALKIDVCELERHGVLVFCLSTASQIRKRFAVEKLRKNLSLRLSRSSQPVNFSLAAMSFEVHCRARPGTSYCDAVDGRQSLLLIAADLPRSPSLHLLSLQNRRAKRLTFSSEAASSLEMNLESEKKKRERKSQAPVDQDKGDATNDNPSSVAAECHSSPAQIRDCEPAESAVISVQLGGTAANNNTSKSVCGVFMSKYFMGRPDPSLSGKLKMLLEQQEYENMRTTSWADLMEEEATKLEYHSQLKKGKQITELAKQSMESGCIVMSSDEEYPSPAVAIQQPNTEWRKTNPPEKQGTKSRFKHNSEFEEASQALDTNSQVSGKLLRRAVKREKKQGVHALLTMSTDDEEGPTSSKYQKRRRKDVHRERIVYEANNSRFNSKDLPLSGPRRSSRESSSGSSASVTSTLRIKESWTEPKLGWCRNETILLRRSKEIEKAKEKPVYMKYLAKVPRHARTKNMPKTPNKYIQYSRRSWDKQVRLWKRRLYEWAGEEPTESCCSLSESTADDISDSETALSFPSTLVSDENRSSLDEIKVEQDAAASLLGYLDIDTRTNTLTVMKTDDESTLKGTSRSVLGPRDFSQL
ncbi:unnamed protein product [Litomosoides sigmodontis]|uniref:Histone RNA hairpin-binding protein RNA-binding domain-containing protein n=1 Tax=Litomosoides sigmodontis TaxID=42156 RepID=A0A3P6SJ28_LITSI|nr:unnamed protein product [Litomosoides sigmodontis]